MQAERESLSYQWWLVVWSSQQGLHQWYVWEIWYENNRSMPNEGIKADRFSKILDSCVKSASLDYIRHFTLKCTL